MVRRLSAMVIFVLSFFLWVEEGHVARNKVVTVDVSKTASFVFVVEKAKPSSEDVNLKEGKFKIESRIYYYTILEIIKTSGNSSESDAELSPSPKNLKPIADITKLGVGDTVGAINLDRFEGQRSRASHGKSPRGEVVHEIRLEVDLEKDKKFILLGEYYSDLNLFSTQGMGLLPLSQLGEIK